jgi:tetraacyldisaccharide 4'-kinase
MRAKSSLQEYILEVIGEPESIGAGADVTRSVLGGLATIYDAGLEAYLFAERMGIRRREHLPVPIISIGNLTVGGTGKTPMTQFLCRQLVGQGKRVAVLSRGHGGASQSVRVVSDDDGRVLLSAQDAGDEPVLLARTLPGVPVLVGKDRRLSGREALRLTWTRLF